VRTSTLVAASIVLAALASLAAYEGHKKPKAPARALVPSQVDASDAAKVALGKRIYDQHCAACHGANLEGQPNWKQRLANGRMPAPPHDESGHTWHHHDSVLFGMVKKGLVPDYAPPGYESDMPAFEKTLSDAEIWAVLSYIESHWKDPRLLAARKEMIRNFEER
jgi:mono/diheme cytochrome c family protein